ncbi:MAG: DnaD domain protein [Bacilli bacterium]|nr:DnaD domain protein [Bacilli bacterium]
MRETLLPADSYIVINKSIITDNDKQVLNMLYLPIIGSLPITLYNILLNDLDRLQIISEVSNHAKILSSMHISTNELIEARNVLEAIGLLKTYLKTDTVNNYIYELYSPVSAHEFFSHPIFNIVLYNNIGKIEYEKLVAFYKIPKVNKDGYTEITHSFSEVFESVPYTSYISSSDSIRKYNKLKLNINSSFDINFLIESIGSNLDKKIFTKDLQELIISLAFLYDIDVSKMQNIIRTCINERGTINREELRKTCRNHYQFDHNGLLPTVIEHTQPEYLRKPIGDNSKLAKMIYTFETISPYDFLKSKHNGAEPMKRDIKLLEDLIIDYKLKPGVVNVLIDYVLKTNDNKLNRSLIETIAGQWVRNKIETVEDAMEIAKKNHKQISKKVTVKAKEGMEKEVPIWFDKNIEAKTASVEKRQAIEDMLKEYR